jgi:hypothetical protein
MIILYALIIDCKRHHKKKERRIEFNNNNKNKEYKKNRYLKKYKLMVDRIDYLYED